MHAEAASVRAFLDLERDLSQHDAPASLRARAREAARDEVVHARLMARLAKRFGGTPAPLRFSAVGRRSRDAIALENVVEGCVKETWAALFAHCQSRLARDRQIRRIIRRIAVDETRHAELAHDIDVWIRLGLDDAARERLAVAQRNAVHDLVASLHEPHESLRRAAGFPSLGRTRALLTALDQRLWRTCPNALVIAGPVV